MKQTLFLFTILGLLTQVACLYDAPRLKAYDPIFEDVEKGRIDEVKAKLDQGYDINTKSGPIESTPLIYAAANGQEAIVQLLLDRGADVKIKNFFGETALSCLSANYNNIDEKLAARIIRVLLNKGADIETRDRDGNTPLLQAAILVKPEMMKLLLDHGADVNARVTNHFPEGSTALILVARGSYRIGEQAKMLAMANLLLERGADVNATDIDGCTALGLAFTQQYYTVVDILKKAGGVPGAKPPGTVYWSLDQ